MRIACRRLVCLSVLTGLAWLSGAVLAQALTAHNAGGSGTAQAPAQVENGCSLAAPHPLLAPHAYPRQSATRQADNAMRETADLGQGRRVEILQSQCVDTASVEYIVTLPLQGKDKRSDQQWIEAARAAILALKRAQPADPLADLDAFLQRSRALPADHGVRAVCNDGSVAAPGECSWDSFGGFLVSVKRGRGAARVAVVRYVSM